MRFIPLPSLVVVGFCVLASGATFAQEYCASCGQSVRLDGSFEHYRINPNVRIQGANGNEAAYREEVNGTNFTVSFTQLSGGKYTISIGVVEGYFEGPGQRLFNVTAGDTALATNFDIFAAAGGLDKVCFITGTVEHPSIGVPLTLTFTASRNRAKFNTIELKDASGNSVVSLTASEMADPFTAAASQVPTVTTPEIWRDPSQSIDARAKDLISRMSLAEKVSQLQNTAPGIPRLGIPAYDYWSEALHGVAAAGVATVFPQAIAMAATWDAPLIHSEADVISTEGRAKFNDYTNHHNGSSSRFHGLTFWSPNINIFRDPRWGRGQETYGEDPFLSGSLAVQFIHGLQGDDPNFVKVMACAKHFAVHSGPEPERHRFDATPPERDLYETYLPQFEMAARDGHVCGFMGAYNSLNGTPACADSFLLTDVLRKQWGFDGYIVSDCGAIHNIWGPDEHHFVPTPEEAAADAVKAGCDICCGGDYNSLVKAVQKGLITEKEIDVAMTYTMKARLRLGLFDPQDKVPYARIGIDQNDTPAHEALALKVAEESIVLLKNDGVLPLNRVKIKRIAVIGPDAANAQMLSGNYNGTPARPVTILDGIKKMAGANIEVVTVIGCPIALRKDGSNKPTPEQTAQAVALAKSADVVIYVGGISAQYEGEEMNRANQYDGFAGGDRTRIELPAVQSDLIQALYETGKPVVFVNCSGSAMAMPWAVAHLPAIVQAWYPGEQGGNAVAAILFGDANPAGRLPLTFYRSTEDLPGFEDYSMSNRTYRYFGGKPEFAFGHGLSYTKFSYGRASVDHSKITGDGTVKVSFSLQNSGDRDGDEIAQVYFRHVHSSVPQPKLALCGFTRVHLNHGESTTVSLDIPAKQFRYWDTGKKQYVVEPGDYELLIRAASDDIRRTVPLKITAP